MTYNQPLINQTLVIDCELMTAQVAGVNKLGKVGGLFVELLPGDNNVSISGSGMILDISFDINPKFM